MSANNSTTPTTPYVKRIQYDKATKDFAMYLNDELQGYANSYLQAEITLNNLVHDLLLHDVLPVETSEAEADSVAEDSCECGETERDRLIVSETGYICVWCLQHPYN
jgi:hypothetical protein